MTALPRYATPRDPARRTLGTAVVPVSRALGYEPHAWQREAWDVAGEVVEDPTSPLGYRMAHPVVVWIVPRRAGKSLGVFANVLQRLTTARDYRARYTAQTRTDAASTLLEEWLPALDASPLARYFRTRLSNGSESVRLPVPGTRTAGAALTLFSPRETSTHGKPTDLGVVDEGWAFDVIAGDAMEAALRPSMKTRPASQLWIVSAAGNDRSTWLARWRDLGRAGTPGVAFLEYGADPDVDDLDDPATLARVHPAVGATIRAEDVLGDLSTMDRAEWLRAYLGVWPEAPAIAAVLDPVAWGQCRLTPDDAAALDAARPAANGLAVAVAPDGARTAIGVAYRTDTGRVLVKVTDSRDGTSWAVPALRGLQRLHRLQVTVDAFGPAGPLVDELRASGVAVDVVTTDGYARACAGLLADVMERRLRHYGQPVLDTAAASAGRRPMGDRWAWARRAGDVTALEAVSLAAGAARYAPSKPFIVAG